MKNWRDSLIEYFRQGIKEDCGARLGVEVEHFIVDPVRQAAVPYSGDRGVRQILTRLMERYPGARTLQDDDFFGFSVPEFTVTLEPAAQIEISIAPSESVSRIGEIYSNFYDQLDSVLAGFGYTAVNAGCQPYTRVTELEMIPKKRYDLMNEWFQTSGTEGMEMMRGTASLQVSIDYASEEDFRNKIRAAYFYSPVLKMLCDNSIAFAQDRSCTVRSAAGGLFRFLYIRGLRGLYRKNAADLPEERRTGLTDRQQDCCGAVSGKTAAGG